MNDNHTMIEININGLIPPPEGEPPTFDVQEAAQELAAHVMQSVEGFMDARDATHKGVNDYAVLEMICAVTLMNMGFGVLKDVITAPEDFKKCVVMANLERSGLV